VTASVNEGRGRGRWLAIGVVAAALVFAVSGGEYSTWNWFTLRRQEREANEEVARLRQEVDSLKTLRKQVESDPSLQERIAREQFGMIAKGEYLYIIETDSLDGE
jgi:cell division protein FtsB